MEFHELANIFPMMNEDEYQNITVQNGNLLIEEYRLMQSMDILLITKK